MNEMFQLTQDIAPSVAIVSVVIYLGAMFLKGKVESTSKKDDAVLNREEQMFQMMMELAEKNKSPTNDQVVREDERYKHIDIKFKEFVKKIDCSRVTLFEYHNGETDLTGRHYNRMSIRHQSVNRGVKNTYRGGQNLPKGSYFPLIQSLESRSTYYVDEIEQLACDDPTFFSVLDDVGIEALYCRVLRSMDGTQRGFILVDYMKKPPESTDLVTMKSDLNNLSLIVEGILSN